MTTAVQATTLSLKTMLVPSKNVSIEFPGCPGFQLDLSFLSRDVMMTIRKKATTISFNKARQPVDTVNDDLFLELYVKACIRGWSGLTLAYLETLAPVDFGDVDKSVELPYTEENALYLMKSSGVFDTWISEQVTDLGNFQSSSKSK